MNSKFPELDGFTIYSKMDCEYCIKAEELIISMKEDVNIIECDDVLSNSYVRTQFIEHMKKLIGFEYRTFPMIFKDRKFIGGYSELQNFLNENIAYKYKNEQINIQNDF